MEVQLPGAKCGSCAVSIELRCFALVPTRCRFMSRLQVVTPDAEGAVPAVLIRGAVNPSVRSGADN